MLESNPNALFQNTHGIPGGLLELMPQNHFTRVITSFKVLTISYCVKACAEVHSTAQWSLDLRPIVTQ